MLYLWVALGSAAGGVFRFAVSTALARQLGGVFPYWTLAVNVAGCLAIGYMAAQPWPAQWRALLVPGFCGGFTTFSAFSLEFLTLQREGRAGEAWLYVALSVGLCLAAVAGGDHLGRRAP